MQRGVLGAALRFLQAPAAARRKNRLSARGKHSDRVQWTKQGAVLAAGSASVCLPPACGRAPAGARELSTLAHIPYARVKIGFDVACLAATLVLTLVFLGHIQGLGIGTVVAAFTMGKGIALAGELYDKRFAFVSFMSQPRHAH